MQFRIVLFGRSSAARFVVWIVACSCCTVQATLKNETWYKRYDAYPPYCSTPEEMSTRAIPPLRQEDLSRVGETRIVHATAIIRHGARTPWSPKIECWDGYKEDVELSKWDCDLTTFLSPPSPHEIDIENGDAANNPVSDAMFLFRKQYDALTYPQYNLRNELNGTCQQGQLLLQGYDQEKANGAHLRNAYVYDGSKFDHDIHMRLLDIDDGQDARPYEEPILRYRCDDDQRTLMSGQILLRGLFGTEFVKHLETEGTHPVIPLHTADRGRDILDPSVSMCPRLKELAQDAWDSDEYQNFKRSKESRSLRKFMKKELGRQLDFAIDCIMTTMCTDRKLPEALNDYGVGDRMIERIYNYSVVDYVFQYRYNDAIYAKLAMGPLWAEIMENIFPIVNATSLSSNDRPPPTTKLAVFSGHDTTILPLLATLGPDVWDGTTWAPYASMMIIEIHEIIDGPTDQSFFKSDHAFRLLYNGEVLTRKMDGCPDDMDLCDVSVLLEQVSPFSTRDRDCDIQTSKTSSNGEAALTHAGALFQSTGGILLVVTVILASSILGGAVVHMFLTGSCVPLWCNRRRRARQLVADAESAGLELNIEGDSLYYDDPAVNGGGKPVMAVLT